MRKPNGYWNKENCYNEAKKYASKSGFKQSSPTAYHIANTNGWLKDYDWFTRPNSKWNYQNCLAEAKKYSTRSEFAQKSSGAYHIACRNKWIDDYTWLPADCRKLKFETSKWNYQNCYNEAKKYNTRTEFYKHNNSAYNSARKHKWIDDYTWLIDERLNLTTDRIDCVYAYEFVDMRAVYIGRTLMKRKKDRDREHLYVRNDAVVKFAIKHNVKVPLPKYIEDNLTIKEGVEKECYWINKYKEQGWLILNRTKGGSIGGLGKGKSRFTYDICYEQARLCKTRTEFRDYGNDAYRVALKNGWIKDYTWFVDGKIVGADKRRKYDYQTCYEEASKYNTIKEFEKGSHGACIAARTNGWMKDYTWFTILWQEKWNRESCYEEAKKYTTISDFRNQSSTAYATACKNKWIDDYTWLQRKHIRRGTWKSYEKCYKEALKYTRMHDFERLSHSAYSSSVRNGWINNFTWLKLTRKPRNYWNYDNCYSEAKKYNSVLKYQNGSRSSYDSALRNGWLKSFTWLQLSRKPRNYWNYENCYTEAMKYKNILEYQKGSSGSYNAARKNGWLKDFHWFKKDTNQLKLFDF